MNTQNIIVSPCHAKVTSTQNMGALSLVLVKELSMIPTYFGKGKVFSENSNLKNLVEIQR